MTTNPLGCFTQPDLKLIISEHNLLVQKCSQYYLEKNVLNQSHSRAIQTLSLNLLTKQKTSPPPPKRKKKEEKKKEKKRRLPTSLHPTDAGGYPSCSLFSLTGSPGTVRAVHATTSDWHPLTQFQVDLALCLLTALGRVKVYTLRRAC